MEIAASLTELSSMHPRLVWDEITTALAAVLGPATQEGPLRFELTVQAIPGFGNDTMQLACHADEISAEQIARLQRTFESNRLVELAAIAIAGLGLYYGGGHEIRDVALRGSGADYLVDDEGHLLEVAGRSNRSDFQSAGEQRWQRLSERGVGSFYVCVAEFETPSGRLAFSA